MEDYQAPLEEQRFALEHAARLPEITEYASFEHVDAEMSYSLLEEAARFMGEVISPLNAAGDREGARLEDGRVVMPAGFHEAFQALVAAGWTSVGADEEFGGGALPYAVASAVFEMFASANMAFSLSIALSEGAIHALLHHADDDLKQTFLPRIVSGEWTSTMDLTEPHAGSDLAALRCIAEPQPDGTYHLRGTKIFITYGDHDLTDNIIHLVLARTPDAPPGSRGISLFITPKRLVNPDGSLGPDNGIRVLSIEHKLGIHASPTCVLSYGEDTPTVAYRIGEENLGLQYMFTMMNRERIMVGNQSLALSQRAYQLALEYAREREQGRAIGAELGPGERSKIVDHADVRRMLLTMRSQIEAMRSLLYACAGLVDTSLHHPDGETRRRADQQVSLLTPVVKAWISDLGVEITSLGIQVHGGTGYVEETGAAQLFRDARIPPIYEGTNGIQAMDLVGRKLGLEDGKVIQDYLDGMRATADALAGADADLAPLSEPLGAGIDALESATRWLLEQRSGNANAGAAGAVPYMRLFGTVAGGVQLARAALAAATEDPAGWSEGFLAAKRTTARFYIEQLLPAATGLVAAVKADPDRLFEIDEAHL